MNTTEKSSKDTFNHLVQDPGWFDSYENKATAFNKGEMCAVGNTPEEATENAQEQGINPDFVGEVTNASRRQAMEINNRHIEL